MPYIGPDTVDLIVRTPTGGLDGQNTPANAETVVPKTNCSVQIADGWGAASDNPDGSISTYSARAALPVDDDTRALTGEDAIRFQDIVFELTQGATVKTELLSGAEDHVRVFGTAQVNTDRSKELVTITPNLGRDNDGQPRGLGPPINTMALAVTAGNTTESFGISGDTDTADYTVALPIEAPIVDNDLMTVRGRIGLVRVKKDLGRWQGRQLKIVTVHSVTGGRQQ